MRTIDTPSAVAAIPARRGEDPKGPGPLPGARLAAQVLAVLSAATRTNLDKAEVVIWARQLAGHDEALALEVAEQLAANEEWMPKLSRFLSAYRQASARRRLELPPELPEAVNDRERNLAGLSAARAARAAAQGWTPPDRHDLARDTIAKRRRRQ